MITKSCKQGCGSDGIFVTTFPGAPGNNGRDGAPGAPGSGLPLFSVYCPVEFNLAAGFTPVAGFTTLYPLVDSNPFYNFVDSGLVLATGEWTAPSTGWYHHQFGFRSLATFETNDFGNNIELTMSLRNNTTAITAPCYSYWLQSVPPIETNTAFATTLSGGGDFYARQGDVFQLLASSSNIDLVSVLLAGPYPAFMNTWSMSLLREV